MYAIINVTQNHGHDNEIYFKFDEIDVPRISPHIIELDNRTLLFIPKRLKILKDRYKIANKHFAFSQASILLLVPRNINKRYLSSSKTSLKTSFLNAIQMNIYFRVSFQLLEERFNLIHEE